MDGLGDTANVSFWSHLSEWVFSEFKYVNKIEWSCSLLTDWMWMQVLMCQCVDVLSVCVCVCVCVCWFWRYRSYRVLHFFLHVAWQRNLTFFNLPVTLSFLPWTYFSHLLTGFTETYRSHVNLSCRWPWSRNVFTSSHLPRGVLHFFLHVPGQ